jgi:hypothetical protein
MDERRKHNSEKSRSTGCSNANANETEENHW